MRMYPKCVSLCVFCLRTPACVGESVFVVCAAPPVSQMLHWFTKQIAANQIRALSSVQTQAQDGRAVCVCVCVWRKG